MRRRCGGSGSLRLRPRRRQLLMSSPDIRPYTLSPHIAPLEVRDGAVHYKHGTARRAKVAIYGSAGAHSVPWDDPSFELWSLNNFWDTARDSQDRIAASRWWEQHQITPDALGYEAGVPI